MSVLLSMGFEPVNLGVRVKWLKHWATEVPIYLHTLSWSNSAELLQHFPSSWGNWVSPTVEWVAVQMSYFALLSTPCCLSVGWWGGERFCEAVCSIRLGSTLWHSSFFLHKLPPWVALLSAGFEPVTLGVRVKWLNHWATEEPVLTINAPVL